MFVTNAEARRIMTVPVAERTPAEALKLSTWQSIEPDHGGDDFVGDSDYDSISDY